MARGTRIGDFAEKLRLALGRANLSRTALAQLLGMDKSVVARWAAGTLHPADHSLAGLSAALGRAIPGFDRTAWDMPLGRFAARLGVTSEAAAVVAPVSSHLLSPRMHGVDKARAATAYVGLWACFFSSVRGHGRVLCYVGRIEAPPDSPGLAIEISDIETVSWHGALIVYGARIYIARQAAHQDNAIAFGIHTGAQRGRASIIEGIGIVRDSGPEGAPAATPQLYMRLDDRVDDAVFTAVGRLAAARNRGEGWEAVLPDAMLARFQVPMPPAPAPTLLRRPISDCWATREDDLCAPTMAERRASLDVVRRLFAPAMEPAA